MKISLLTASAMLATTAACYATTNNSQLKTQATYETASAKLHKFTGIAPKLLFTKAWNMAHETPEQQKKQEIAFQALQNKIKKEVVSDVAYIMLTGLHLLNHNPNVYPAGSEQWRQYHKNQKRMEDAFVKKIEIALEKGEIYVQCDEAILFFAEGGEAMLQDAGIDSSESGDTPSESTNN